jgi:putative MATE family efflux protein
VAYLRIAALGLPAMLAVLALSGVLRGLRDTRTPLLAAGLGFGANIALNVTLVYGVGLGMAGSAWGTVLAQTGMAAGLAVVVVRAARRQQATLRPNPAGVLRAAGAGTPLLVRTVALRATLLTTTWVAAGLGDVPLAAYQVSATVWTFLAFALDALAIAGQALTGHALGAGDVVAVRAATAVMTRWGVAGGAVLGAAVVAASPWLPALFTQDLPLRAALTAGLVVVGLAQPISGYAFVLDGVLIGAGDGRWLAVTQVTLYAAYLPLALGVAAAGPSLLRAGAPAAVAALWAAFAAFMALRALALGWRARQDVWLVTGLR